MRTSTRPFGKRPMLASENGAVGRWLTTHFEALEVFLLLVDRFMKMFAGLGLEDEEVSGGSRS